MANKKRVSKIKEQDDVLDENKNERTRVARSIKEFRLRARIPQKEFAKQVGMLPAQLCNVEKGKNMPSLSTICRIAEVLGVTVNDLMYHRTFKDGPKIGDLRKGKNNSAILAKKLEDYVSPDEFCDRKYIRVSRPAHGADYLTPEIAKAIDERLIEYCELETRGQVIQKPWLTFDLPILIDDQTSIEHLTTRIRTALGIGSAVVMDYVQLLETFGIKVIFLKNIPEFKLSDEASNKTFQSCSLYDKANRNAVIVLNNSMTAERKQFRLIYELGIIYLYANNQYSMVIETKENRRLAKYFAACFLVPRDCLLNDLFTFGIRPGEWTYEVVLAFKSRFGVSAESFVYRLLEIKRINKNIADDILDKIHDYYAKNNNKEPGGSLKRICVEESSRFELLKICNRR
ncbi:MAG: ImmA/IrrE family metallo-endopeptidase [Kiritimatiellae bacterium]|nr:ImmA/IrrE family metallo-endopeptidase [Kiritimatiellia bacterium]